MKAISPAEVLSKKSKVIPDAIFDAINELLVKRYNMNSKKAIIKQDEIISLAISKDDTLTRELIFKNEYLDIEFFYMENGWKVEYRKPFDESFDAYFTFTNKE